MRLKSLMGRLRDMKFSPPKSILNHPGVEECVTDGATDYKFEVWLKEGWAFTSGRNAGGRGLFCHTVADFKKAEPRKVV
jgi:hypothetical protein